MPLWLQPKRRGRFLVDSAAMGKRITSVQGHPDANERDSRRNPRTLIPLLVVAGVPMLGAVAGGWLDERRQLGFTTWRNACRAAGLDLAVLADFTRQLLPMAIAGTLFGGAIVLAIAFLVRRQADHLRLCLAAHTGCALTLPLALFICASALPLPLMLIADVAITAAVAAALFWLARPGSHRVAAHP